MKQALQRLSCQHSDGESPLILPIVTWDSGHVSKMGITEQEIYTLFTLLIVMMPVLMFACACACTDELLLRMILLT